MDARTESQYKNNHNERSLGCIWILTSDEIFSNVRETEGIKKRRPCSHRDGNCLLASHLTKKYTSYKPFEIFVEGKGTATSLAERLLQDQKKTQRGRGC